MNKSYVRTFDPNLENFCTMTSRENYLHGNCLQFMDVIEECHDQISLREQIINDLKLKLQEEYENSLEWKNKMIEERSFKNMARREFEWKCQREIELSKVCSTHEIKIEQLKTNIISMTQQNKELNSQVKELAKIILEDDNTKRNYQSNIEVMKKDLEKLQSYYDAITTQRDKAEENLTKISHKVQQNKNHYELCIESLKNELCTKANDLSNSLEERENLLEEISSKNKIISNLNSKLQSEHENFQKLQEKTLKCMVEKEAKFKQLHKDMIYENSEYKESNEKMKIEITKKIEQNNDLILQLNEEKSRFKIMESEAIVNTTLSKEIEKDFQSRILKNKRIICLACQRGKDFVLKKNYLQAQDDKMVIKIYIFENQLTILVCVIIALWHFHAIPKTKCVICATKVVPTNEKINCPTIKPETKVLTKNDMEVDCQQDQLVSNETQMNFDLNLCISKHVIKQAKFTINVFLRIYYLQEGAVPWKFRFKLLWECLQRTMDLSMWKNYAKQKSNFKNEISIFIYKKNHLDLEHVSSNFKIWDPGIF